MPQSVTSAAMSTSRASKPLHAANTHTYATGTIDQMRSTQEYSRVATEAIQVAAGTRIWTIPNVLSMLRLALVPVFLVFIVIGDYVSALVVLIVASLTDLLDGYLARRLGQITRLGQLLDPAADRLYIFAALVGLAANSLVPWWIVVVIVARDVFLLILG